MAGSNRQLVTYPAAILWLLGSAIAAALPDKVIVRIMSNWLLRKAGRFFFRELPVPGKVD